MSVAVVEDAVNVGRRLQGRTRGEQILIYQQVYGLVHGYVRARAVEMVEPVGQDGILSHSHFRNIGTVTMHV